MPSKKQYGEFFGCIGALVSYPFAILAGTASVLDGKPFNEGADAVIDSAFDLGTDFGEKHGKTVANVAVRVAVGIVVNGALDVMADASSPDPHDTPET
jgi:hypothetical protein